MSDLTCVGVDGITRSLDEHYHIQRDVEQDPYGAHKAIQDQAARIKELEEQVKDERERCHGSGEILAVKDNKENEI
jgi:hypothetical protein